MLSSKSFEKLQKWLFVYVLYRQHLLEGECPGGGWFGWHLGHFARFNSFGFRDDLSRKFWSGENFGPGDQNSRKIGPPRPLFPENLGPAVE